MKHKSVENKPKICKAFSDFASNVFSALGEFQSPEYIAYRTQTLCQEKTPPDEKSADKDSEQSLPLI